MDTEPFRQQPPQRLDAMVADIQTLPPLSSTAHALLGMMQRDDYSLMDVARMVEADGVLTANVLKVVNAPSFGLGQQVSSVSRAVSFLGVKLVVGIAIGSCAEGVFNHPLEGYAGRAGQLWEHGLATAIATREFSALMQPPVPSGLAYTAGILHDIGKAVLSEFMKSDATSLVTAMDAMFRPSFQHAEAALLGASHTTLGGLLAKHWRLPDPLAQAIAFHHTPQEADAEWQPLCCAVQWGDALAMSMGADTGADAMLYEMTQEAPCLTDALTTDAIERILLTVHTEFEKTRTLFFGEQ